MKVILLILTSKLVMTPIAFIAIIHWILAFGEAEPAGAPSLVFNIADGNTAERWGSTVLVIILAVARAYVWKDETEDDIVQ